MTREEAIEMVRDAFDVWQSEYETSSRNDWSKEHEARDMAIKALEQEPCYEFNYCPNCGARIGGE